MRPKHLMISTALVIPAMLLPLASCNDSNRNPAEPSVSAPNPASTRVMPKTAFAAATLAATTMTTAPARHNPRSQFVYKIECFEGATDSPGGGFLGVCQRFSPTLDGAEINTFVQGPNGSYAGVFQPQNFIRGRLLTGVANLNFSYAGGPHVGGAPRLSIPIDEDNDGTWENFAFMDAPGCNDGDEFVGQVEGRADNTCNVNYAGVDYPNWSAFKTPRHTRAGALPGTRSRSSSSTRRRTTLSGESRSIDRWGLLRKPTAPSVSPWRGCCLLCSAGSWTNPMAAPGLDPSSRSRSRRDSRQVLLALGD